LLEQGLRIELDRKIGRGEHGARDGEGKGRPANAGRAV
jgi:hypothetical protein